MAVVHEGSLRRFRRVLLLGSVIGALILGAGILALWAAVINYTDPKPQPLPRVSLPESELHDLQRRLARFQQALRQDSPSGPLVLSAAEINALLETTPAARALKDKLRIEVNDNQLLARISLPLRDLHPSWVGTILQSRFLNAHAGLNVSLNQGRLDLRTEWLKVRSKAVPGFLLNRLRARNLADQVNEDARAAMAVEKLQRIEVVGGKVLIYPAQFESSSG